MSIQVGDVFKHMNLPEFDAAGPQHQRFAQQAHQTHDAAARAAVVAPIEPVSLEVLTGWLNR